MVSQRKIVGHLVVNVKDSYHVVFPPEVTELVNRWWTVSVSKKVYESAVNVCALVITFRVEDGIHTDSVRVRRLDGHNTIRVSSV